MCCCKSEKHSKCCHGFSHNPALWSKKKKKEVLKQHLENLEEQKKDIEQALKELGEEE